MKRTPLVLMTGVLLGFSGSEMRAQEVAGFRLFPEGRIRTFPADGSAHRFGASRRVGSRTVETSIGSTIPIVEASLEGTIIQLAVGASVHSQLDPTQSISLLTADYAVDFILLDIVWSSLFQSRFGIGHTSHHLGDNEQFLQLGVPLDYSRDYVQGFLVARWPSVEGFVYAGGSYSYIFVLGRRIDRPWLFQAGLSYEIHVFDGWPVLLTGADLKLRQESGFGTTQRFIIGFLHTTPLGWRVRAELSHQRGLDPRGQFTGQRVVWTSAGIVFEF